MDTIPKMATIPAKIKVDDAAVEERAAILAGRLPGSTGSRTAWLLRAVTLIDLTSLTGEETSEDIDRLCARARQPLRVGVLEALGATDPSLRAAAVCVYPPWVANAVEALSGTGIPVAAATGFPAGLAAPERKLEEIRAAVAAGAAEIDAVIRRSHVLEGDWKALYDEVRGFRDACGAAHLKVILGTGELKTLTNVARASRVCIEAGADFIKTSTGKEAVNATLPVGVVMARAIREHHEQTGNRVGLKPAGGIRTVRQALEWMALVERELGSEWLRPELFRIGASGLLADIERELRPT